MAERREEEGQPPAEVPAEPAPQPIERMLVVSAHPDDPEFSSGATIARLAGEGVEVFYCICTDGSQGGEDPHVPDAELSARRYAEQRAAADVLGVREVTFLGFRDGHLEPNVELRRAIAAEIRRRRPDVVITHTPMRLLLTKGIGAFHPDHLAVGQAALAAVYPDARNPRAFPELLEQGLEPHAVREVWIPAYTDNDHYLEATEELVERKVRAIMCHRSQFEKPGMEAGAPGNWVRERMRQQGERAGFEYAEGYRRLETG